MIQGQNTTQNQGCVAIQSFQIGKGSGDLTFNGTAEMDRVESSFYNVPTITADGSYAFGRACWDEYLERMDFNQLFRDSSGALAIGNFSVTYPSAQMNWEYFPLLMTADPANRLAVALYSLDMLTLGPDGPPKFGSPQLASFTVDSAGNTVSMNTLLNMPTPNVYPTSMILSPSGKFLAVAGNGKGEAYWFSGPTGLQVFHFNGADPITPYSQTLTTSAIDNIRWDTSNHLYALSSNPGKLYDYTVTSAGITQAPGSPYSIPNLSKSGSAGLAVIPKR
jgi:hypothetical protein